MATPLSAASLACATVAAGMVKSMIASAAPIAAPASAPIFTPWPTSVPSLLLPRALEGGGERAALGARDLGDQHLAHAAGGAGNGDLHFISPRMR